MSNSLMQTIMDMQYGKRASGPDVKVPNVMVVLSYTNYLELSRCLTTVSSIKLKVFPGGSCHYTIWQVEDFEIHLIRSPDMSDEQFFVFSESEVTTITYQKSDNATNKNTLP
jgi:hypothetical protein